MRRHDLIAFAVLMIAAAFAPLLVYPAFLTKLLCFALFAMAFNLLVGYVGLLSFGHAMFFGGSAYVTGHALKVWGWSTELSVLAGMASATVMGLIIGLISIRRQGIYFAMITLALAQMFFFFCVGSSFTGGEDGISAIPRKPVFGVIDITDDRTLYYVVLAVFAAGFLFIYRTIHSPFGQVLQAIRENEPRAVSLGYRVDQYKLVAFVLSASLAGLAGSLKVLVFKLASLVDVGWGLSGEVILMTLVGGIGTVFGPVIGAAFILTMQNYLTGLSQWVPVIQGAIFVVVVLLFQRGIAGEIAEWLRRSKQKAAARK
ncbi:MAG: branched-chain amino acid ABC transporter permease [Pseudomonadota bacterium]